MIITDSEFVNRVREIVCNGELIERGRCTKINKRKNFTILPTYTTAWDTFINLAMDNDIGGESAGMRYDLFIEHLE